MKVLHINCNYIGTTLHQHMVEMLDKLGIDNSVFVPICDQKIAMIEPNNNVYVSECFQKWDRFIFGYKQRKIIKALTEYYPVAQYDLIHAYTLFTDGNCARRLWLRYHVPYVVAVRNTDVNTFFRWMPHLRGRGIQILKDAQAIFFLSETYRRQVFEKYIPEKDREAIYQKTFVIPNGIDDFWHQNTVDKIPDEKIERIKKHKLKIIYAGKINKGKNIPTTLNAIERLQKKGWDIEYTIVGKIENREIFACFQDLSFVTYIPPCSKEQLIKLYRQNDIFVMPSIHESFGLVYAEAMSQGLPVIYTRGQGFDGQFPDGEVGYAVDCRNSEELATKIVEVCKQYDMMASHCKNNIDKFQWERICQKYNEIYKKTVSD